MNPKHELAELIDETLEVNRWTLAGVSARAAKGGHALSAQNLSRIRTAPVVNLVAKQARALAYGLDLPISVVVEASLKSMGFTSSAPDGITPEEAIRWDERMSARDRRLALAIIRELREDGGEHEHRSAPNTGAEETSALKQDDVDLAASAIRSKDGLTAKQRQDAAQDAATDSPPIPETDEPA